MGVANPLRRPPPCLLLPPVRRSTRKKKRRKRRQKKGEDGTGETTPVGERTRRRSPRIGLLFFIPCPSLANGHRGKRSPILPRRLPRRRGEEGWWISHCRFPLRRRPPLPREAGRWRRRTKRGGDGVLCGVPLARRSSFPHLVRRTLRSIPHSSLSFLLPLLFPPSTPLIPPLWVPPHLLLRLRLPLLLPDVR